MMYISTTSFQYLLILITHQRIFSFTTQNIQNTFVVRHSPCQNCATTQTKTSLDAQVGIFYGTSTGSTEEVADMIHSSFSGQDIVTTEPIAIDDIVGSVADEFNKHDALIVGTPTWNTGADTERSGTGWDEIYYGEMQEMPNNLLKDKKVAVFGLGDQISYCDNYADATGELYDVFEGLGCKLLGHTSQDGYEHEESKAVLPQEDKFCGLLCDAVNQPELSEKRVSDWVSQIISEGLLEKTTSSSSSSSEQQQSTGASTTSDVSAEEVVAVSTGGGDSSVSITADIDNNNDEAITKLADENAKLRQMLEENSRLLEQIMKSTPSSPLSPPGGTDGFTPHYNPKTKKTMWTSEDGRTCYYTTEQTTTSVSTSDSPTNFRP